MKTLKAMIVIIDDINQINEGIVLFLYISTANRTMPNSIAPSTANEASINTSRNHQLLSVFGSGLSALGQCPTSALTHTKRNAKHISQANGAPKTNSR